MSTVSFEVFCNRDVSRWLRMCADLEHAAEPEFKSAACAPPAHEENAALPPCAATLEGAQTETVHGSERLQGQRPGSPASALLPQQPESGDPQVCAPSFFNIPLQGSSPVEREAHNLDVGGSTPLPASISTRALCRPRYRRADLLGYPQDWIAANSDLIKQRLDQLREYSEGAPDESFDDFALVQHVLECAERASLREAFRGNE